MPRKWKYLLSLIGTLMFFMFMAGCHQPSNANTGSKIKIVTSTPTYGELAQKVSGKYGHVDILMKNPAADPHDFEPSVQAAKQTSQAQIAVYNGLGYDAWMKKLINDRQNLSQINVSTLAHTSQSNPHVWYQLATMERTALKLATLLGQKQPAHKEYFQRQARKYIKSLAPLKKQLQQIKAHRTQQQVAVSEPVFDYSLQAMGYQVVNTQFAQAIEEGRDPAPQDVAHLQQQIRQRQIAFFVVNRQTTNPVVQNLQTLARRHQIPIIAVRESQPAQQTYVQWMQKQYQAVLQSEAQK